MTRSATVRLFIALVVALVVILYIGWRASVPDDVLQPAQPNRVGDSSLYPPQESPGAVDSSVTQENIHQTICISGYTVRVRPSASVTNRIKREFIQEYELQGRASDYELDHIIPLELGGCADCLTNLWMEPLTSPGAHEKDRVENYLHREVCNDRIPLEQAQKMISQDWYSMYLEIANANAR